MVVGKRWGGGGGDNAERCVDDVAMVVCVCVGGGGDNTKRRVLTMLQWLWERNQL